MAGIWDCVRNVFDDNVAAKDRADSLMWVVNPSLTPEDRKHVAEIFDKQLALYDGKMTRVEAHERAFVNTRVQMEREGIRLNGQHAARCRQSDEITSGQLIHFRDGYETYKEAFEWRVSRSRLKDLPVQGQPMELTVRVGRWRCRNRDCPRRIFCQRLPEIAPTHARETKRFGEIGRAIAHALGGRAGARLSLRLGIPVSRNTLLRRLKRWAQSRLPAGPIQVIGVDEWAWRKVSSRQG